MLKMVIAASVAAVGFAAAGEAQDSQTIDIASFDEIDIRNGMRVYVELGGAPGVTLEGDGSEFEAVEVDVHNGELVISRDTNLFGSNRSLDVIVRVTGGQASEIQVRRGAVADITGVDADMLEIEVSTGGELDISGQCGELEVDMSTGAMLDARELVCQVVDASGSTGSSARVHATGSVTARATMGASVRVSGNPERRELRSSMGGSARLDRNG